MKGMNLIILGLGLIAGCSLFQQRPMERLDFVTGENISAQITSDEIQENLTKTASNAGGYFQFSAMPLTAPYLRARRQEQAIMRGLTPRELAELEMEDEDRYLNQRFCARIEATITRHEQVVDLREWQVRHEDHEGVATTMTWRLPVSRVISSRTTGAHGLEERWHLSGEACADRSLSFAPQFSIILTPPFTPWPFPGDTRLDWSFYENAQEAREKSPTFKRYRGY